MLAPTMRPKFQAGIYYVPVPEGVYLRGNHGYLMLKGKSLYPLLERLIPYLDGSTTLEGLTHGLDAERKRMITHLLEKLFAHQFLKDGGPDQASTLLPREPARDSSNLTFVESFQTSAAARLESFRHKHLLILGSGRSFASLVQASLQCGMARISASVMPEGETAGGFQRETLDFVASCNSSEQTVQLVDIPCWDNQEEVRKFLQGYEVVLHFSERPILARAQLLNRLCVEEQKTFIQAVIIGDQAWIGPLVCAEAEGCWECAWRRLQANLINFSAPLSHYAFHDRPASDGRFLALPEMTMLAHRLLFPLFKYFTQTGSTETGGYMSVLHLETGLSERHAFLPHPHCQACQRPVPPTAADFLEQIQRLQHQASLDRETFLKRLTNAVVDSRLGLFTVPEGDDFVQVPLAISKTTLSDPMLQRKRPEVLTTAVVSRDGEEARWHTAQEACTRYAANLVDQRRLFSPEARPQGVFPALSAGQLVGMPSFPDRQKMWTWALDLQTQQVCPVSAEYVFPAFYRQDQEVELTRGLASGMSWDEAICQALLDWCNYLTVEALKDAQRSYAQVDLSRVPLDAEGKYLYHLLKTVAGPQISVYDVTGSLHVPTFALCFGEKAVAYSTHCDEVQALSRGFKRALQQYQAERYQEFEYAVAPVPDFPLSLRGTQLSIPRYLLPDTWIARRAWLLQRLLDNGLRACVVPLEHDPALVKILPFIVRVLLSKVESQRGK